MERSRTPELIGGIVLVIIGVAFLASYLVPDLGRFVVLAIGIGILVLFAATRVPAALIGGCIVTGVGAGIVLSSLIGGQMGGGLFLISLGAGFLLVWFAGRFLAFEETRVWPLIPGAILVLVGAALLPGAGWAVALIVIGVGLVIAGVGSRSAARPAPSAQPGAGVTSGDRAGFAEAPQVGDDISAHDLQASHIPGVPDADDRVV
jgi:hypothetical protein